MNVFSTKRVAAFGMAGALALGTVVSVGALTAADAATTAYSCTLPVVGATDFPVSTASPLPKEMLPGESATAHAVTVAVSLPEGTVNLLKFLGNTSVSGTVKDTAYTVGTGDTAVPVSLTALSAPMTALPAAGGLSLPLTGSAGAFTAPKTLGAYPVSLPGSFVFVPANAGGPIAGDVPCALGTGATGQVGTMTVVSKYSSTTTGKLKNAPITHTKHAKVAVKVVNGNGAAAAGKVVAKEGTRTLASGTLSGGRKTLTLRLLKKGIHKVVISYGGDATTKASKKLVKITVKR